MKPSETSASPSRRFVVSFWKSNAFLSCRDVMMLFSTRMAPRAWALREKSDRCDRFLCSMRSEAT